LPPEIQKTIYPFDDYVLARSLVESDIPETDLFAGIRQSARV
jgi:mycothiol S-conjugate amidase